MNTSNWPKFFLALVILFSPQFARSTDCESMFKSTIRSSAGDYIRMAQGRAADVKPPQFANPKYEQKAQATWTGVEGPRLIQDFLVPGTSLISHTLKGANEPGIVKTTTGNMIHLRAEIAGESTNIGVSYNALKENFGRKVKSYVRESAEAVVLFIHGGGSNTTGHHVAANIMDFLNTRSVDVISIDLKWHGEGSRNSPESVRQELEILRQYVRVLTGNTKKPIFLVGHSMGGVVADLYMRHFPKDDLFTGVVSLSTVADAAPGQSLAIKRQREASVERQNQSNEMIPADERNLGAMLARQGKISPTCGFYCDLMMTGVDWTIPGHQGAEYIPALYVIGRGDALYQGNEAAFTAGVERLKNVEFVVFEQRRDIKAKDGQKMTIGHLIFDHKPLVEFSADVPLEMQQKVFEGKIEKAEFEKLRADGRLSMDPQFTFEDLKSPEVYARIRNFISRVVGRPLPKIESSRDPLDDVVQEYLKNLAFREFAKSHVYLHMRATPKGAELGQVIAKNSKAMAVLQGLEKKGTLSAEQKTELLELRARNLELLAIMANKGTVLPKNLEAVKAMQAELDVIRSKMVDQTLGQMPQTTTALKLEADKVRQGINQQRKIVSEAELLLTSDALKIARVEIDAAYDRMMAQDGLVRDVSGEYLLKNSVNGRFPPGLFENLPTNVREAYERYTELSAAYQKALQKFESKLMDEVTTARVVLTGSSSRSLDEIVHAGRELKRLNDQLRSIQVELELRSQNRARLWSQLFELQMRMASLVDPGYFVPEVYTIETLLSKKPEDFKGNTPEESAAKRKELSSVLQKIWSDWNSVWSERPQGTGDSEGIY